MCGICLENRPAPSPPFPAQTGTVRRQRQHKMSPWIKRKMLADMTNARGRLHGIYLHLVAFYGTCRQIYHTWTLWVCIYIHMRHYLAFALVLLKFMFHYYASLNSKNETSKVFTIHHPWDLADVSMGTNLCIPSISQWQPNSRCRYPFPTQVKKQVDSLYWSNFGNGFLIQVMCVS